MIDLILQSDPPTTIIISKTKPLIEETFLIAST